MTRLVLLIPVCASLMCASVAVAQGNNGAPGPPPANPATDSAKPSNNTVSPAAPVITVKGVCASPSGARTAAVKSATPAKPKPDCKTVVTRAEFEQLSDVLQVPPTARKQFATQYATALIMANEAHKRGLDRGQRYEQLVRLTKLQVLARQMGQNIQEESAKISDQQVADYYHNNQSAYQEATLERIYIPRGKQQEVSKDKPSDADVKKKQEESEAAMKKEADDLRARAAGGEDFSKLQGEAYQFANFSAAPPQVKMEKVRATSLPAGQRAVLDMKAGDVSPVFSDPGGYFVYKLDQKDTIPLDKVREEIHTALQRQRMQDSTQSIQQSATPSFNDAYFASTPTASGTRPGSVVGGKIPHTPPPPVEPK